jgi:hypothetical protein
MDRLDADTVSAYTSLIESDMASQECRAGKNLGASNGVRESLAGQPVLSVFPCQRDMPF